jgi:hypothetical protein
MWGGSSKILYPHFFMAKFFPELTDSLRQFIAAQHMFFTATAPIDGRINLSPKGINTFRCLDSKTVAYLNLTGSGNETSAHLYENGRLTIMFCSFEGDPLILRLYGHGNVIHEHDPEWADLIPHFDLIPGARQIVKLPIDTLQTSCGMGVPLYDHVGDRDSLIQWASKKGKAGVRDYWKAKNQTSIDGLPTYILDPSRSV